MLIMMDDYESLKREVAEMRQRRDRARGAFQELKKSIKRDFGVSTLKEAKKLLERMIEERQEAAEKYMAEKKKFEKKWKKHLRSK